MAVSALMVDDPGRSASSPGRVHSLRAGADSAVVSRPGQTGRMEVWSTLENRLSSGGRGVPPPSGPTGRGDDRSAACGQRILTSLQSILRRYRLSPLGCNEEFWYRAGPVVSVVKMTASGARGVPPPSGPTGRGELSAALGAAVPIDELSHTPPINILSE